jgi:Na+-translocating ferredoxin:NAD+ oxidoreductase RnfA subunit
VCSIETSSRDKRRLMSEGYERTLTMQGNTMFLYTTLSALLWIVCKKGACNCNFRRTVSYCLVVSVSYVHTTYLGHEFDSGGASG